MNTRVGATLTALRLPGELAVPAAPSPVATDTFRLGLMADMQGDTAPVDSSTTSSMSSPDRAFAGNPLAVVFGADGLRHRTAARDRDGVQPLGDDLPGRLTDDDRGAGADYRVRIFTPGGEIPFAGHPTLGTAWALRRRTACSSPGARRQACGAGLIGVDVPDDEADPVELTAAPRDHARALSADDTKALAGAVGRVGLADGSRR